MPRGVLGKHKQTWRDWMPPDMPEPPGLLTRSQVLKQLRGTEFEITTSELRFWEQRGVLPRPVRHWYEGATRAVYPPWEAVFIVALKEYRAKGYSLEQAGVEIHKAWDTAMEPDRETGETSPYRFPDFLPFFLLQPHLDRFAEVNAMLGGPLVQRLILLGYATREDKRPVITLTRNYGYKRGPSMS